MMKRFARSWALTKQSYRVLMQDKELMILPILSGLTILIILATFVAGMFIAGVDPSTVSGTGQREDSTWLAIPGLLFYIVSYSIGFFFQAALIAGALQRMNGGDPTVRSSLALAWRRIGSILVWGVIAGTVGAVLKAIQERSELVGKILVGLTGAAWSLATFFMVPVLVIEERSIGDSFKHSTSLFKKTWGEMMIGQGGVGLASILVMLPIVLLAGACATVNIWLAVVVAGPLLLASIVFFSALQGVYVAALYRYATTGETPKQFDTAMVQDAFAARRRR